MAREFTSVRGEAKAVAQPKVQATSLPVIKYTLAGRAETAIKLDPADFSAIHLSVLRTARINDANELVFDDPRWRSVWLGAGEEKSVYLVIDNFNRAFALEVLDKWGYLDGRLSEGHYLAELYSPQLINHRWQTASLDGHVFSGTLKAREFIYGQTLADLHSPRTRRMYIKASLIARAIGRFGRMAAMTMVLGRYAQCKLRYRDAHEANVMVELVPLANPERKSHYGLPVPWLEPDGHIYWRFIRLTPIDVRG